MPRDGRPSASSVSWQQYQILLDSDLMSDFRLVGTRTLVRKLYRIHEFAKLTGVTVRALHHYDRLGLLKPQKTAAGYRLYAETDLERLEQIIALKFLGIPLKQIKVVLLGRNALDLLDALRLQRAALEEKQRLLERAIGAIHDGEKAIQESQPASATILRKIIQVMRAEEHEDFMKPYFGDKAWVRWSKRREPWPSEAWIALFRDVQASIEEDPGGAQAQALATRWLDLFLSDSGGNLELYIGMSKAWIDRKHWPMTIQRRFTDFDVPQIIEFVRQATLYTRKKYFSEEAWEKLWKRPSRESLAQRSLDWLTLYCEAGSMIEEDPASERAQTFLDLWLALAESTSGGDHDIRAGWRRAWADRQNSPARDRKTRDLLGAERVIQFIRAAINARKARPALWIFRDYYQVWAQVLQRQDQQLDPPARVDHLLARIKLFGDVAASLNNDPCGEIGQALATRWLELLRVDSDGDAEIEEGVAKSWADRGNWPAILKRSMASHLHMNFETIDKVVEFIGKAVAHRNPLPIA